MKPNRSMPASTVIPADRLWAFIGTLADIEPQRSGATSIAAR